MSEARALLALTSVGLDRSSRIHLRSLHEYYLRATLVLRDTETARKFQLAAAREMKKYLEWLDVDAAIIDEAQKEYLTSAKPGEAAPRETEALGGSMQALLRAETKSDAQYATNFGYPSLFSHGSILALIEVSRAIKARGQDFSDYLFSDGRGAEIVLEATFVVQRMSLLLIQKLGIGAFADWDTVQSRVNAITSRDGYADNVS